MNQTPPEPTIVATIEALQVGSPHKYPNPGVDTLGRGGGSWQTSFFRTPSPERRWLHATYLEGNQQADTKNHGQPDKAVLLYDIDHYAAWRERPGLEQMGPGGMAENLTLRGLTETSACIGDIYQIGEARIQVTSPRFPCYKISRRWGIRGLEIIASAEGRTGWYCQTIAEGWITPGATLELIDRPYPAYTVALVNELGHARRHDPELATAIAELPMTQAFWRTMLLRRAGGTDTTDE